MGGTTTTIKRRARLEVDGYGVAIQGCLHPCQTIAIPYTGVAGVNSGPIVAQVVRIRATTNCYVKFSSSSVLAVNTDMYLPANTPEMFSMAEDTYISAIQVASGGTLYVTLMD